VSKVESDLFGSAFALSGDYPDSSPKRLRASVTERRFRAPALTFREVIMTIRSIKSIWFDAAATSAMGEAFERACKTLQDFGSAVPEIVANFIITAAKNGERDAGRLYKQVLADYGIEDTSMPLVGAGGTVPAYAAVTRRA